MPRPEITDVTFQIDGREITAPGGMMLVDAAQYGDIEIPVFCYEPKLGAPVGACRMCLVEIEGIPKLQTACSTPVKDGLVVTTQSERVQSAQRSVVEFLLVNHPLDCPVCDKGGECPLQDITFGWGGGTSRFIEPKRHFRKPLALSPLIAIDRERCILCYRCVRFSQEVAEDYQLVLQERGAHSYVSTFDGTPYVAPFTGNITELCPVGALTSASYRFRARPWDIEGAGTVCALCPSQCNVELTVRDDRVLRVLARDNSEVDDGWLCDKGRYGFQYTHNTERFYMPWVRRDGELQPATWEEAYAAAGEALARAGSRAAAIAGGETTNEEAFLTQLLLRDGLGSPNVASAPHGDLPADVVRSLANPALQATMPDLEYAHTVLVLDCDPVDEMAAVDLRIRKGVRRNGVKLAVASARPTALDPNASTIVRTLPHGLEGLLVALDAIARDDEGDLSEAAHGVGVNPGVVRDLFSALIGGGDDIVVVASERTLTAGAATALLNLLTRLGVAGTAGAGLLLIPAGGNGRGIREAGMVSNLGPGYGPVGEPGLDVPGIARGLASGELSTLFLMNADPLRQFPDREAWEAALMAASDVIVSDVAPNDTILRYATVVFPGEAYPEKEGTLVHPVGRVQRLRATIGRPGTLADGVRAGWQVLRDLAGHVGLELDVLHGPMASQRLFDAAPIFRGLSLEALGGQGLHWPASLAGASWNVERWVPQPLRTPPPVGMPGPSELALGTFKTLWAAKEVDLAPVLAFARPRQVVELAPADAERLGVVEGDVVDVAAPAVFAAAAAQREAEAAEGSDGDVVEGVEPADHGPTVRGTALVRASIPAGSVFVAEGVLDSPANALVPGAVAVVAAPGHERERVPITAAGGSGALADQAAAGDSSDDPDAPSAAHAGPDIEHLPAEDREDLT